MYTFNIAKHSMLSGIVSLIAATIFVGDPSYAQVINGDFETGDLTGFTSIGDTSNQGVFDGISPTQGTRQALITSINAPQAPVSGIPSVPAAQLEAFLELPTGTLDTLGNGGAFGGAVEGSAIQTSTTLTANAGDVVTFDFNLLTQGPVANPNFNDFSFFTLSNSQDFVIELADTFLATTPVPNPLNFDRQTGYQSFSFTIPTAGTYRLGFGVADVGDATIDSALLVDNIAVAEVIPEPSSILGLLTFGAFGALAMLKRKQGKCQS